MLQISEVCSLLDVDGIRGDMTINKAATALTALEARDEVTAADVQRVIAMCLNHRCVRLYGRSLKMVLVNIKRPTIQMGTPDFSTSFLPSASPIGAWDPCDGLLLCGCSCILADNHMPRAEMPGYVKAIA